MKKNDAKNIIDIAIKTKQKEVHLNFLNLTTIPEELWQLHEITHLFLTGNKLTALPAEIAQLSELQHLDISGNQISSLAPEVSSLRQLKALDISSNKVDKLPINIGDLSNLEILDIFGNSIAIIPDSIARCQHLTQLRAGNNEIESLPNTIGKLKKLSLLDISYNEIEEFPSSIFGLLHLNELDLRGNKVNLPFSDFEKFQFNPNVLLEKIRELQHQSSQIKIKSYRQTKAKLSAVAYDNSLDSLLRNFVISDNKLTLKATPTLEDPSLLDIAACLENIHNDLLVAWSITNSVQGLKNAPSLANSLMDKCYGNCSPSANVVEDEYQKLVQKLRNDLSSNVPSLPQSSLISLKTGKGNLLTIELTTSRRALLYLTYTWALSLFSASHDHSTNKKAKQNYLRIITHSLEGHGLIVKNDPRIPSTLLCLSKRPQKYLPLTSSN